MLDLLPVSVPMLMCQAKQDNIGLLAEVLRFLHDIDNHLLNRSLICSHFLLDQLWSLTLKGMDSIGAIQLFLDVGVVIERFELLKEHLEVFFNLSGILRANMPSDILTFFPRVHIKGLADLLEVTSVPAKEA